MTPEVLEAIEELQRQGATLAVEGRTIRVSYRCPASSAPSVARAISVLRANKPEVIALLSSWPAASADCVARFGIVAARLYPLIGQRVWTPQGVGVLLSVFVDRCEIHPDGASQTIRVLPEHVRLIQ